MTLEGKGFIFVVFSCILYFLYLLEQQPDLGPNRLQRLSADDNSRQRVNF